MFSKRIAKDITANNFVGTDILINFRQVRCSYLGLQAYSQYTRSSEEYCAMSNSSNCRQASGDNELSRSDDGGTCLGASASWVAGLLVDEFVDFDGTE